MGLDVSVYAEGLVSDAELSAANDFLMARGVFGFHEGERPLERNNVDDGVVPGGCIEWLTLLRYYAPGYERGWWPEIHNGVACIKAGLPQCRVFYGPDSGESAQEATDEFLASMWTYWLGPGGVAYRERHS